MSPRPPASAFAEAVYAALEPAARRDAGLGWPLLAYVAGLGEMFAPVDDAVRDSEAGPGWTPVVDPDRCPAAWLPWLAQMAGVRLPADVPEADKRAAVSRMDFTRRGSVPALREALRSRLTGGQYVLVNERHGSPWRLAVRTLTDETPDEGAALAAALSQKAGGLVLDYAATDGATYDALAAAFDSYDEVRDHYDDYGEVLADLP